MNWKDCIKDLNGAAVITHKGDRAVIIGFELIDDSLNHFIGKYKVRFLDGGMVGWYTRAQLAMKGFEKWL